MDHSIDMQGLTWISHTRVKRDSYQIDVTYLFAVMNAMDWCDIPRAVPCIDLYLDGFPGYRTKEWSFTGIYCQFAGLERKKISNYGMMGILLIAPGYLPFVVRTQISWYDIAACLILYVCAVAKTAVIRKLELSRRTSTSDTSLNVCLSTRWRVRCACGTLQQQIHQSLA